MACYPLLSETLWEALGYGYGNEPDPPDWGLPFADTPEEVGTVVIVWAIKDQEFTYTDGATAYREDWMVKLVDFEKKAVAGEGFFLGESLTTAKSCPGDVIGQSPWADLMDALRALPTRPVSGATMAAPPAPTVLPGATP